MKGHYDTLSAQYASFSSFRFLASGNSKPQTRPEHEQRGICYCVGYRVWLGLSLFPSPPNAVRCICDLVLDKFGDHLLGCGRRALRTNLKRHNSLRDMVFHLLSDDSGCKLEQGCSAFNYKKPGDIFHPGFLDGLPAYFDITVYATVAATCPGAAADAGEREKDKKHNDDVTHA